MELYTEKSTRTAAAPGSIRLIFLLLALLAAERSAKAQTFNHSTGQYCYGTPAVCLPAVKVYRLYSSSRFDHMRSVDPNEAAGTYKVETGTPIAAGAFSPPFGLSTTIWLLKAAAPASSKYKTVPLYRCKMGGGTVVDHFESLDPKCEGFPVESTLGHIFTTPPPNALPLQRCYHYTIGNKPKGMGDHMSILVPPNELNGITLNPTAECTRNGYNLERVLGYVYFILPAGSAPIGVFPSR